MMKFVLKVVYESIVQALQQLTGNKLRSFLSLLGVTIGIFCIIGVRSAVDSLEFTQNEEETLGIGWFSESEALEIVTRNNIKLEIKKAFALVRKSSHAK